MFFIRLAITALRSLDTHFLRSLLATLGVLIGVGSVVACMSILEGMTNEILRNLSTLGSNVLYVSPAIARVEGHAVGASQKLVPADVQTLRRELPDDIIAVSGEAIGSALVKRFQKSETATVIATTDAYFSINDYNAERGRVLVLAPHPLLDEVALHVDRLGGHLLARSHLPLVRVQGHQQAHRGRGGGPEAGARGKIAHVVDFHPVRDLQEADALPGGGMPDLLQVLHRLHPGVVDPVAIVLEGGGRMNRNEAELVDGRRKGRAAVLPEMLRVVRAQVIHI